VATNVRLHARRSAVIAGLAALTFHAAVAAAQRDFSKVEIKTTRVAEGVYMLEGAGGNIGVHAGPEGVLVIDDQFAPLTDKIKAAITAISDQPIRFLFNTHWHGDHTGGNENFAKAGVAIVAHDNVRKRLSAEQYNAIFDRKTPPSPAVALPIVTFNDSITFHLDGEDITCFHVPNAHTDGDAIVWFRKANVVHMGDCLFNGIYPVLDVSAGGSAAGMIAADDRVLAFIGADTKVIPGHGPLATRKDLEAFRDMMTKALGRVQEMIAAGKSLDEIQKAKPLADLDATWGKGFITPDVFLKELYLDLSRGR
jgi:glyoxylase-like metal-dependent hydrolase (beta-lactamase superfamily II)